MAEKISTKKVYYGSGYIYDVVYDENTFPTGLFDTDGNVVSSKMSELITFIKNSMTDDNELGYLKNGYELDITAEKFSDKSDLGQLKITAISDENGTAKFSLFNANAETISRLYPTAKYGFDETTGFAVTEVGGLTNLNDDAHVLIFRHSDTAYGDTVTVCVGKNTSGFSAIWKQDSVTPFACEYELIPYTDDGRIAMFVDCAKGYAWTGSNSAGE